MHLNTRHMWAVAAAMSAAGVSQAGDCPCRQQAATIRTISAVDDQLPPAPMPEVSGAAPAPPSSQPPPVPAAPKAPWQQTNPPASAYVPQRDPHSMLLQQHPLISGYQANLVANRWGMTPPPGTLGRTYLRRSTLIPHQDHPRTGIVAVHLPESADVSGRGLKVKWTGDEWLLETTEPMVPGVPHIYAIKAEWDTPNGKTTQVRWVRLIMGHMVDLEF